jgi:hypothetical protein
LDLQEPISGIAENYKTGGSPQLLHKEKKSFKKSWNNCKNHQLTVSSLASPLAKKLQVTKEFNSK